MYNFAMAVFQRYAHAHQIDQTLSTKVGSYAKTEFK
jgi:hypothetical protein